ncbi:putative membrane protein [Fibrella aestuarina BUZ 2]|uniref:Putative membrane protein n=1 Tax=Fibrella aestuarina BUZ 2 TaxID=1166018 RepID=I0KBN9_9BACT|nr:low temperature requirement protein A [Fibrella aestuarina]CCH01542.1 putative membrane protein [Fibrella aestuarina BUZ 2]
MADSDEKTRNVPTLRSTETTGERRTSWAELLNDLAYTAIVMQLAMRLSTSLELVNVLEFLLLYVPVWWLWNGQTHYATRFDNVDDIVHRLLSSAQLIGLFILGASISKATEERSMVYALAYASVRAILLIDYARAWWYIPETRPYVQVIGIGFSLSMCVWIGSIWVEPPYRYGLWALALLIELGTPLTSGGKLHVDFPPDVRHLPERYGLFTLLVLGQAVTGVVTGLSGSVFFPNTIIAAVLGGVIIVGLWWAYFDRLDDDAVRKLTEHRDGDEPASQPAIRRYTIWLYTHLPLTLALTGYGVAIAKAIEAVDQPELPRPVHHLLIGSVATYLFAEAVISLTTLHSGPSHVSFQRGILVRVGAGLVLIGVGIFAKLGALALLLVISGVITVLILSDQLSPEAPESTERVESGMGK